jgi:hypothetical protein
MKWYESDFATEVGKGIFIFLLCLGAGTCSVLTYNTKIVINTIDKTETGEVWKK